MKFFQTTKIFFVLMSLIVLSQALKIRTSSEVVKPQNFVETGTESNCQDNDKPCLEKERDALKKELAEVEGKLKAEKDAAKKAAWDKKKAELTAKISSIGDRIGKALTAVKDAAKKGLESVGGFFKGAWNKATGAVKSAVTAVGDGIKKAGASAKALGEKAMKALEDGIKAGKAAILKVRDSLKAQVDGIKAKIKKLEEDRAKAKAAEKAAIEKQIAEEKENQRIAELCQAAADAEFKRVEDCLKGGKKEAECIAKY